MNNKMNVVEYIDMENDTVFLETVYSRTMGWLTLPAIGYFGEQMFPVFSIDGTEVVASPVFVDDNGGIDPDAPACAERCTRRECNSCVCPCADCRHIPEDQGRDWAWVCA